MLWGAGGTDDDDVLALRRRLFEHLESTLDSFARSVDLLTVTLARVLSQEPADMSERRIAGQPPQTQARQGHTR